MRIDSSGNVGIGTTSPTVSYGNGLHIAGGNAGIKLQNTNNSDWAYVEYADELNTTKFIQGYRDANGVYGVRPGTTLNADSGLSVDSSGNVGIGTASPQRALVVSDAGTEGFEFYPGSSAGNNTVNHYNRSTSAFVNIITTADQHIFGRADGEKMRIDSSGRLLIGNTATITTNGQDCALQVVGSTAAKSRIAVINRGNDASGGGIQIVKSRGTIPQVVAENDQVGGIFWCAGDGYDYASQAARIECYIDALPGGSDTPGRLVFSTTPNQTDSPIERMRIDNSGRVLIGSSVVQAHANMDDLQLGDGSGNRGLTISSGTSGFGTLAFGDSADSSGNDRYSGSIEYYHGDNSMRFYANIGERMRIDSSGRVLINRSSVFSSEMLSVKYAPGNRGMIIDTSTAFTGNSNIIEFRANGTLGGSITFTNNGTSTAYVGSSDYRMKENVVDLIDAVNRVKNLQPRRFNFIASPNTIVDGFIAHEAQTVVPEAVTGTKDEVDEDGKAVMQGIDQSKLVPLLTAALQEAIAKIETLETEVAALKNN